MREKVFFQEENEALQQRVGMWKSSKAEQNKRYRKWIIADTMKNNGKLEGKKDWRQDEERK